MILLTGKMVQVAHKALAPEGVMPPGLVRALVAVLAEVDRDYVVTPKLTATAPLEAAA